MWYNLSMECPKCGAEIDKSAMVCPNCKKVLKIICPVCRTVNEKNICKKCGEVLVTKCVKCGKINLMKNQKCQKCGYPTEYSALQAESNAETFAVLKIEFPNIDIIKTALGSNQVFTKFKANLDKMITSLTNPLGVRRQIVKNSIYIIRFNKVYTLTSSANSAIMTAVEIANAITRMNVKLLQKKNVYLKSNFTIMKRDADKDPYDIETGFQANMLNQNAEQSMIALESCQLMTDEDFYEYYNENYKLESLDSVLVNGKMKRFYEINIKELINIDEFMKENVVEEDIPEAEIPDFVRDALIAQDKIARRTIEEENELQGDELYNIDLINFDEINCVFYTVENVNVLDTVVEVLQDMPKGIIAIKASNMYQPYTLKLLATVDEVGIYQNVIPITCHDDMKYSPYSFFRDLVSAVFEYTVSQKLFDTNDFSMFSAIDNSNLVKDLITLNQRDMQNLEDTRDKYFNVFLSLLQAIPDTLIYIENFEKIDSSSMFVLEQLFEHFDDLDISYMISYDKSFSLHKSAHFLLSRPYYTEITLVPTPFNNIIEANKDFYQNILTDYYFQRISKYAAGSTLFLDYAIQYLVESGVYQYTDTSIAMINPKTTMIPSSLSKLMKRRLNLMKDDKESIKFLAMCVLLGTRIDPRTASSLGFANWKEIADKLSQAGYLYFYNNCIYFPNYNLLRENILAIIEKEHLQALAQELFNLTFDENMPSPVKAYLYEILDEHEKIIFEWEKLANINLSMGDFSSYLNCSDAIIKSLDKYSTDWSEEDLQKYKNSIYTNISNNMFEYNPEETRSIADKTLDNLQKSSDIQNFMDLCSKMIQGAIAHGEYIYALNLTHKLMAAMDKVSFDPTAKNFNAEFLLMTIIHVKILFNLGAYNDCIDIGYNVLNVLDNNKIETIKFNNISTQDFKEIIKECVAYIGISDAITLRENVSDFLDIVNKLFNFIPKEYTIFIQLQNLIKGQTVQTTNAGNNIFANMVLHIINAFTKFKNNPDAFAKEIYKTKLIAKETYMQKFELFADALIGYCYVCLNSFIKSSAILYQIIQTSKEKGMNSITFLAWYIMSILNIKQGKYDIAYGILNNSTIQIDKMGGVSDYLTMLNKVNMYKVLKSTGENEKAQICYNQAQYIIKKYGLNYNINIDNQQIPRENQDTQKVQQKNDELSEEE